MKINKILIIILILFGFFEKAEAEKIDSLLNQAQNMAEKGEYLQSIEIILNAKKLCIENSDQKKLANTYIVLSNIYLKLSKFSESLQNLLLAEKIAKTENYIELNAEIYNSLAVLYYEAGGDEQPEDYMKKAESYIAKAYKIVKDNDLKNNEIILNYGVMIYMYKNIPDSALNYFKEEKIYINTTDYKDLIYLNEYIGHIYKNCGDYRDALNSHFESLKYSQKDKNNNLIAMNYSNIAFFYTKLNKLDSALFFAKKSLFLAEKYNNKYALQQTLEILVGIYYQRKNIVNYHKYQIKIDSITKIYYSNETTKDFIKMQFELNMEIKDMKINLLEKDNQLKNNRIKISVVIFSIILLSLIVIIILMKKREKYKRIIAQQKLELIIEKEESIKMKNDKLNDEIKRRNRELITKTMLIVKNKKAMQNILEKIKKLKLISKKSNQDILKEILSEIKINSKDFWDDFFLYFNGIHTSFLQKLSAKFPDLTNTEIKITTLIKLNLSTNDISKITSTSPRTIDKHRTNIRKKINVNTGETLSDFLNKL